MDPATILSSALVIFVTMLLQNLQYVHLHRFFARQFHRRARRLAAMVDPFLSVTIDEYVGGWLSSSVLFNEVKSYLGTSSSREARHLQAECAEDPDNLQFSMDDDEEVADVFRGATLWWKFHFIPPRSDAVPWTRAARAERRYYQLEFHERHRDLVFNTYLPYVRQKGRDSMVQRRQRKLYANITTEGWGDDGHYRKVWSHVPFQHPKTFDTLAMDPAMKKEIISDLDMFKNGKEYHKRIGRAWKRGYLLFGPPGTGKSTMVAAMANYLDYDIYDLDLTAVRTNVDLRKLLIETTNKSIIVFEDIDCCQDLTGKRKKKENKGEDATPKKEDDTSSKVTLSGLLNFLDGLWSACREELLIVLTTNHIEKLDPALTRTGRVDRKISMSYCDFESFMFLAKIHLDVESHELFGDVEELLKEAKMVPADVGGHLTPKSINDDAGSCLGRLVKELQKVKEDAAKGGQAQEDGNEIVMEDGQ